MEYASIFDLKSYISFYISKYNERALESFWYLNLTNMIEDVTAILDPENPDNAYIRFRRDEFDIFFDNWRKGRQWRPATKQVFYMYKMWNQLSFEEMTINIWIILNTIKVPVTIIYGACKWNRIIDLRDTNYDEEYEDYKKNYLTTDFVDYSEEDEKDLPERKKIRIEFWNTFIPKFNETSDIFVWRKIPEHKSSWFSAKSWLPETRYCFTTSGSYVAVELSISKTDDKEYNKRVYDYLFSHKKEIEEKFWDVLLWERLDEKIMSRISYRKDGANIYDKAQRWEIMAFFTEYMIKLESSLREYLLSFK